MKYIGPPATLLGFLLALLLRHKPRVQFGDLIGEHVQLSRKRPPMTAALMARDDA
jgi:hypothetical protein